MIKTYACVLLITSSFLSVAQNTQPTNVLPKGHYVVIAAFSPNHEDYATKLIAKLNKDGLQAKYAFNPTRKYWYVYLNQCSNIAECVSQATKIRSEGVFPEAWAWSQAEVVSVKPEPEVQKTPDPVVVEKIEEPKVEQPIVEEKKEIVTEVVENPPAKPVYLPQTLNNTPVFLSLYNTTNNEVIDGDVDVIDTERSKLISKVQGNTYISLPNPGSKTGQLSLMSNTFGYRKEQLELNYKNTEADTVKPYVSLIGNFYMINFGLSKIQKGDISTLYNVYFFNDAVVMLPESKYQLNSLLKMMTENPKMKITLHGHTNGNGRGKIIYMGPSKDFFGMTKDVVNGTGSAKELSAARAETIRQWLISQGIADNRINVKGWGGGRMIHDKNSAYARKNIRVDVEVTED